jgi:phosphotriesterase-related protein
MTVQTVAGPIEASELGFTYMHEHVVMNSPDVHTNWPHLYDRAALLELATSEMRAVKELGVDTIVDMTPADYHREPELVRDASRASGVHVVHATGGYWITSVFFRIATIESLVELFRYDIEVGMNGSEVRAGILKVATDRDGVTRQNDRLLRAAARTQLATGVPINTHTNMGQHTGLEQLRVFQEEGVDLAKVVIGHSNDTDDVPYLEQLIEQGCWVSMDRFGIGGEFGEEERVDLLVRMCERGYAERLTLSHDRPLQINWMRGGIPDVPHWNWRTIPTRILPKARERGVSEEQIRLMTVENPRRVFEG